MIWNHYIFATVKLKNFISFIIFSNVLQGRAVAWRKLIISGYRSSRQLLIIKINRLFSYPNIHIFTVQIQEWDMVRRYIFRLPLFFHLYNIFDRRRIVVSTYALVRKGDLIKTATYYPAPAPFLFLFFSSNNIYLRKMCRVVCRNFGILDFCTL